MENLGYILSMVIYAHGKQSYDMEKLKESIRSAWSRIKPEVLVKLYKSLSKSSADVFGYRGNSIA